MAMKLLGTTTSPYTRKVRILLKALGQAHELVDTRTDVGRGGARARRRRSARCRC